MPELIDRQAVLKEISEFQIRFNETGDSHERVAYAAVEHCMLVIKAALTIQPEQRRGRWQTFYKEHGIKYYSCSACAAVSSTARHKYCPNCGAHIIKTGGGGEHGGG